MDERRDAVSLRVEARQLVKDHVDVVRVHDILVLQSGEIRLKYAGIFSSFCLFNTKSGRHFGALRSRTT